MQLDIVPQIVSIHNDDLSIVYALAEGTDGDYAVGTDGSIWSRKSKDRKWKRMRPTPSTSGHVNVKIKQKTRWVHILVLTTFRGPCPLGMECRHLNGIPSDNRLDNIEWNTKSINAKDRTTHGVLKTFGDHHPQAQLTGDIVRELRGLVASGVSIKDAAEQLEVGYVPAGKAVVGITWKHIPGAIRQCNHIGGDEKQRIRSLKEAGHSLQHIMDITGHSYLTVYNNGFRKPRHNQAAS